MTNSATGFEEEIRSKVKGFGLVDTGEENGRVFMWMEFLDGITLKHCMAGPSKPIRSWISAWRLQTGSARHTARESFIATSGRPTSFVTRRGHAKILDFGLAKVTGNTSESTGNTVTLDSDAQHFDESRSDAGTVAYMSVAAVDKIGKGRVWSGAQAKELGLVDELLLGQSGEVGIQRDSRDSLLQPM